MSTRILFCSPLPPPHYGSAISSEMCLNILNSDDTFEVRNIKINYSFDMTDVGKLSFKKISGLFKVLTKLIYQFIFFRPQVVYIVPATAEAGMLRDFTIVQFAKWFSSGKLIVHLRSRFVQEEWKSNLKRSVAHKIINYPDKLIVLGKELTEELGDYKPASKVIILPNAIPKTLSDDKFESIIANKNNDEVSILFLSNMDTSKGWPLLLEACALLKDTSNLNFICHFAGAWPSEKEESVFSNFIKEHNLVKYVNYHGVVLGDKKRELLAMTDITVFPSSYKFETFGRVIIESMEYGIPVISSRIGSTPSIIDNGEDGYLLNENTAQEICKNIQLLFLKTERERIGRNARIKFLERYTIDLYAPKFKAILADISK